MEETAYHEAGHAYMATRLGGIVQSLTIEPDNDDGPARFGDAQIVWHTGQMTAKEFHHKLVMVALAGPVAEMVYRGEPLHPGFVAEWADDWKNAWSTAAIILPDERLRLAFLEEAARQLHQQFQSDRNWSAIAALADELLAHETLDAEQVQEVLQFWMNR